MAELPGNRRLSRLEWVLFALFIGVMIYYAIITEIRSAFYDVRMTDFGVYLRAAWAARTGNDMYAVTCDNGWHYCYPPTFALFLMPLADPPGDGFGGRPVPDLYRLETPGVPPGAIGRGEFVVIGAR